MNKASTHALDTRAKVAGAVGLALLAVAGNVLSVPLFFAVSFIFGSVAAMLAVALLGTVPALLVAIAGGLYTVMLWGHPYALLIFSMEALTVGVLYRRGLRNLVLADLAYWLVLGVPLVLFFYRSMIGMDWESATLIALKQPLNGLFNALLAGLLILGLQLSWRGAQRMGLEPPRLASLLFHALLTAIVLAGALPIIHEGYSQRIQQEAFLRERLKEQARLLAERIGAEPDADSARWQARLAAEQRSPYMGLALVAHDGRMTALQGDVASMTAKAGQLQALEGGLAIWLPTGDMPAMQRWKQGRYRVSMPVSGVDAVSHVVIEQAAGPLVRTLGREGLALFFFLASLLLLGIFASRALSRWLTRPLSELEAASGNLTAQIANGVQPALPSSPIQEYGSLGHTLRDMSGRLAESFLELRRTQAGLEEQIETRTADLNRFKSTLDRTLDCVFMFDAGSMRFFYANEGALQQIGYTREELLAMHPYDIKPDISEAQFHELIAPLFAGEQASLTFQTVHQHKNGQRLPVEIFLQYIAPAHEPARFVAIVRDITERKQAETALQEQAQHTQTILDNMVDGIITIDQAGIIHSFNPAAAHIFAYTSEEVLGHNVKMLMPNPHRDAHDSYLRNYRATGVARIIGIGREVEGQRKDGSLFPMDLAISEITHQGEPMYVGMVRDITERKRVERMKSEFVSTVSHELRTPLTAISGALGLIAGGALGELPGKVQQMIAIAHRNSQRLTHLINDLLDMEKIAAGKLRFDMQPQPLAPLIEHALEANRAYGAERRVTLALTGDVPDTEVRVDSQRLMQVLSNLLSNAVKYSPEDGVVEIAVASRGQSVRVTVTDHGPGIPKEFRSRIFQKFAQADSSDTRQKGGTGLGLAITRELVERMGGRVGFDSAEGEGASFFFELPLWNAQGPTSAIQPFAALAVDAPRVLVVEDETDVAHLLGLMLGRAGYAVDIAASGAEALLALQRSRYAAMTLDLMLPDISGLEVIRQARLRPETVGLPIVVVSARVEEGRLAINGDFSSIDWLAKPIDEARLLALLEKQLSSGASSGQQPRVLHVEDDADLHQVVRAMVGSRFDFELATTLREARARVALERFDVVILDITLPDGSGWDLLPEIRARQPDARVVILSGTDMTPDEVRKVEAVLLKSQASPGELLDAINTRIHPAEPKGDHA